LNAEYYRTEDEANPGDPPRGEEEVRAEAVLEVAQDLKQLLQGPPLSQSKLDAVEKQVVEVEMDVSDLPDDKLGAPWN